MSAIARIRSVPLSARQIQASKHGIADVRAALDGPIVPMTVDEILAEREQWRLEDDARRHRQAELRLVSKGRAGGNA